MIFGMKWFFTGLIFCFLVSCNNQPEPVQDQVPETSQTITQEPVLENIPEPVTQDEETPFTPPTFYEGFDPSSISQEQKNNAKMEIQQLIEQLNSIIKAKNYNAWVTYLSSDYFSVISSPEYLNRISQSTVLVKQNIVLKSARDYFNHVVVPARTNDRVDEIEFESQNRVKAYTVSNKGERLRLYDLEKTGNEWKIIN